MKAITTSCSTCGSELDASASRYGPLCLACILRAGYTPGSAPTGPDTTWAEVFPQLDVEHTLREEEGLAIYLARVLEGNQTGQAILQVVSGERFHALGGAPKLTARARQLAVTDIEGLAPILDFGDLGDAFFLVTQVPPHPALTEILSEQGPEETSLLLKSVAEVVSGMIRAGQDQGIPLRFEPSLCFVDPDLGTAVQTPLLAEIDGNAVQRTADRPLAGGARLGAFELQDKVGEGGFGDVWRARQERPVKREVAIKILKGGLHSQRSHTRFEIEQQALAKLDHPHIARFFDGGTTAEGRPYFAMEWIEGESFTRHCQRANASLPERLDLFRQVCEAVHHAHQKGIIHRDLKPSNVMVRTAGDSAAVKVIDFGIARAIEEPELDQTQLTRAEEIVGTPASMSPEQAAGSRGSDLDARADVYGLGVLLYELLTGKLPFNPKLPPDELRRRIRKEDPRKPSLGVESPAMARNLKGDLDWIVMRCLEKDPERRYASVSTLLADLERHAGDEPVEAGPPEFGYRMKKFVRRRKAPLAAGMAAVLALIAASVISLVQLNRAKSESSTAREAERQAEEERAQALAERDTATAISGFLADVLQGPDPEQRGPNVKVVDLLDEAAQKLRDDSEMLPERRALLLRTLGNTYRSLGQFPNALAMLEESFELFLAHADPLADAAEEALGDLVAAYWAVHRFEDAERELRAHCERLTAAAKPDQQALIDWRISLAKSYKEKGAFQEALTLLKELVADADHFGEEELKLSVRWHLATVYGEIGKAELGIEQCRELLPKFSELDGAHSESHRWKTRVLAKMLRDANRHKEAAALLQEALDQHLAQPDQDPIWMMRTKSELALSLRRIGRKDEAITLNEQVLETSKEAFGPHHPETLTTMQNLAFMNAGGVDRALKLLGEVVDIEQQIYPPTHPTAIGTKINYLAKLFDRNRDEEALAICRELAGIFSPDRGIGSFDPRGGQVQPLPTDRRGAKSIPEIENSAVLPFGMTVPGNVINVVVSKLVKREHFELAIPFGEVRLAIERARFGEQDEKTALAYNNLGMLYSKSGRHEDALTMARKNVALSEVLSGREDHNTIANRFNLAIASGDTGDRVTALRLLEECLVDCARYLLPEGDLTLEVLSNLAWNYSDAGRYDEATQVRERLVAELRKTRDPDLLIEQVKLAQTRINAGQYAEGMAELGELLPALEANEGVTREFWLDTEGTLASAYMHVGNYQEAASRYENLFQHHEALLTEKQSAESYHWLYLAACYRELRQNEKAIAHARRVVAMRQRALGADDQATLGAEYSLGATLVKVDRYQEAIHVLEALSARLPVESDSPSYLNTLARLATAYQIEGRSDDHARVTTERRNLMRQRIDEDYAEALEQLPVDPQVLVPPTARWRWFRPSHEAEAATTNVFTNFQSPDYDDSEWTEDRDSLLGGFGYEDFPGQWTDEVDLHRHEPGNGHHLALFRHRFTTTEPVDHLALHLQHDDGVIIFLDGKEIARENVRNGPLTVDLQARQCRNHGKELHVTQIELPGPLAPGEHLLAISLHNHDCWNEDLRLAGVRLVGWKGGRPESAKGRSKPIDITRLLRRIKPKRVLVSPDSEWSWLHPVDGVDPATTDPDFHQTFFRAEFDHTSWMIGKDRNGSSGGFGYGDKLPKLVDIGTPRDKALGKSAYFRHRFSTTEPHANLELRCQRDDGIVVYLDGHEVARNNMNEGEEAYELSATVAVGKEEEQTTHRIPLRGITLQPGEHVLAISLHNHDKPSSDLRIGDISLVELDIEEGE